eukprot:SAG31_NODE_341_length_17459_cov_29.188123_3_plen_620_part_00
MGKKGLAPADAARREQKKKEKARNKKERQKQREAALVTKDTSVLYRELVRVKREAEDRNIEERNRNVKKQRVEQLEAMIKKKQEIEASRASGGKTNGEQTFRISGIAAFRSRPKEDQLTLEDGPGTETSVGQVDNRNASDDSVTASATAAAEGDDDPDDLAAQGYYNPDDLVPAQQQQQQQQDPDGWVPPLPTQKPPPPTSLPPSMFDPRLTGLPMPAPGPSGGVVLPPGVGLPGAPSVSGRRFVVIENATDEDLGGEIHSADAVETKVAVTAAAAKDMAVPSSVLNEQPPGAMGQPPPGAMGLPPPGAMAGQPPPGAASTTHDKVDAQATAILPAGWAMASSQVVVGTRPPGAMGATMPPNVSGTTGPSSAPVPQIEAAAPPPGVVDSATPTPVTAAGGQGKGRRAPPPPPPRRSGAAASLQQRPVTSPASLEADGSAKSAGKATSRKTPPPPPPRRSSAPPEAGKTDTAAVHMGDDPDQEKNAGVHIGDDPDEEGNAAVNVGDDPDADLRPPSGKANDLAELLPGVPLGDEDSDSDSDSDSVNASVNTARSAKGHIAQDGNSNGESNVTHQNRAESMSALPIHGQQLNNDYTGATLLPHRQNILVIVILLCCKQIQP